MGFVVWLIVGLVAGAIARFLVPGKDPMGWVGTLGLGLVGSIVGGLISVIFTKKQLAEFTTAGLFLSIIGAIIALLVWRRLQSRT